MTDKKIVSSEKRSITLPGSAASEAAELRTQLSAAKKDDVPLGNVKSGEMAAGDEFADARRNSNSARSSRAWCGLAWAVCIRLRA